MVSESTAVLILSSAVFIIGRRKLLSSPFQHLLLSALGLYVLFRLAWKWVLYPKYFSPLRHLPQAPGGSFLMGQFPRMFRSRPGEVLREWADRIPNEGIIRYLDIFNQERLAIVQTAALADVLVHRCYDFEKPVPLRKAISRILGLGLFLAEGDVHKMQRKKLMPAFAFRHVKDLYPLFWAKSRELVLAISKEVSQALPNHIDAPIVEVGSWAIRATLDIIGVAGMGEDFNAIAEPNSDLQQTYRSVFSPSRAGQLLGVLGFLFPGWMIRMIPLKRNNDINRASGVIRRHCQSLIQSKKQALMEKGHASVDILEIALTSGAFTDEELEDQLMTFLAAGHETTASALTWVVYLLCRHPEVQIKLRQEVRNAISDQTRVTADVIDNLTYLYAVCQEALRLFPPVSVTFRVAVRDTTIIDRRIPMGTAITLPPWAVNASRDLWGPDATKFDPERWMEKTDEKAQQSNYAFMTFLHGPRSCIGEKFARAELACLVAAWVGAFETNLADKNFVLDVRGGITSKPKDGLPVRIKILT